MFWTVKKRSLLSLFCDYFLFFDVDPPMSAQLLARHKVRVWIDAVFSRKDTPYIALICRVRKRDVPEFIEAMKDLKRTMLICGHPDYVETVRRLMDRVNIVVHPQRQSAEEPGEEGEDE